MLKDKKTILIFAYFFPPCGMTAAHRPLSWVKYFPKFGFYPIVITRNWDVEIKSQLDLSKPSGQDLRIEKYDTHEVHYIPFKGNVRDVLYVKHGDNKFKTLRKILSLLILFIDRLYFSMSEFSAFYEYAKELTKKVKLDYVLVTAQPYLMHRLGYKLKKDFPEIKWVADYRDAWTTSEINLVNKGKLFTLLGKIDKRLERKWLSNASFITSVSYPLAERISKTFNLPGYEIQNGFELTEFDELGDVGKFDKFTITYVGTLYPGQNIELFIDAMKRLIDEGKTNIELSLPGLSFDVEQTERVRRVMTGYEKYVSITERIPKLDTLLIEKKSHLLLYVGWEGFTGVIGSKVYEYLASGTKLLVAPGDNSCIDEIMEHSKAGAYHSSVDEVYNYLKNQYAEFENGNAQVNTMSDEIMTYSRENQARLLAELLTSK
jgi:glycosyltransferase involved in cell wall biosynthesis